LPRTMPTGSALPTQLDAAESVEKQKASWLAANPDTTQNTRDSTAAALNLSPALRNTLGPEFLDMMASLGIPGLPGSQSNTPAQPTATDSNTSVSATNSHGRGRSRAR
jgi:hypothetical protein